MTFRILYISHLFFFTDPAPTDIYTLSYTTLFRSPTQVETVENAAKKMGLGAFSLLDATRNWRRKRDRKSTRLNSSHVSISYAVFCLKKKNASSDASSEFWTPAS